MRKCVFKEKKKHETKQFLAKFHSESAIRCTRFKQYRTRTKRKMKENRCKVAKIVS